MKVRPLVLIATFISLFLSTTQIANADAPRPSASQYEISSYCNEVAVQRLYTVLNERYSGQYVATSDQYSILDEQFNNCLRQAGYKLKKESEVNLNFLMN